MAAVPDVFRITPLSVKFPVTARVEEAVSAPVMVAALLMVVVPVAEPIESVVAAPPMFRVVAVVFIKLKVVWVVERVAPFTASVELNVAAPVKVDVPAIESVPDPVVERLPDVVTLSPDVWGETRYRQVQCRQDLSCNFRGRYPNRKKRGLRVC